MTMVILLLSLFAALIPHSHALTCDECYTNYQTSSEAACTKSDTYITCLETASGSGCPTNDQRYQALSTQLTDDSCIAGMSSLCMCQKDNIARLSVAGAVECTSLQAKLACISGDTTTACDDTTIGNQLATATNTAITNIGSCSLTNLCTCERDYAVTNIQNSGDKCTALKKLVSCIGGKDDAGCATGSTSSSVGNTADLAITNLGGSCSSSLTCDCEREYAKHDISTAANKCLALKKLVSCIGGKDDAGCATGSTSSSVGNTADLAITNLGGSCSSSLTCDCEREYAKHDISTAANKCLAQKKFVNCLVDKTDEGCVTGTPITLGTSVETNLGTCTDFSTSSCSCLLAYVKTDISTAASKCTAKKQLVTCLLGKGDGCLSGTTAKSIGTTVIDTDIPGLTSASCALPSGTCDCEQAYVKADISTSVFHCTALGVFVNCLKQKTDPGCSGSVAVTALGTTAETNYGTLTSQCPITGKTCGCEVAYVKMPYGTTTERCTAEKTLVHCLMGKTDTSCNGATAAHTLAVNADTAVTTSITDCAATKTDTCGCEATYASTDITANNAAKCTAVGTYITCLRTKTNPGCVDSDTVPPLAGAAETTIKTSSLSCTVSATCQCDIDYTKATRTSPGDRCTAAKNLIACVKGLKDLSCDDSTKASDLATVANDVITADCTPPLTDTCTCEKTFALVDLVTQDECTAKKDYMDCLSMSYGTGCNGVSKRSELAASANLDISSCTPTDVCGCQTAYARVDNTEATLLCAAIKANLDCLDMATQTNTGCKSSTTIQTMSSHVDGKITSPCVLTESCKCQRTHLMATRTTSGDKCTALKAKISCLLLATDNGCDGTTSRDAIVTAIKGLNSGFSPCSYSTLCTNCLLVYGEADYSDPTAHCTAIKAMMDCLSAANINTDMGCNDVKTVTTLATEFENVGSCASGFSTTCQCQVAYMKSPGSTAGDKCTAVYDYMHCLDLSAETSCSGSKRRDEIATTADGTLIDGSPLTATCRTDRTTTCSDCQTSYALKNPTVAATHCGHLHTKLGCLAGKTTVACKSSVGPHTVASDAKNKADVLSGCLSVRTDTCSCEVNLATTDISVSNTVHCDALKTELSCLKGKTAATCDPTAAIEEIQIAAMQAMNTIGTTDCPVTETCACEIAYAVTNPTTVANKCTARLTELGCLSGKTDAGCDGSSTMAEIDRSIKQWMDTALQTDGATNDKCTNNPVCLCEIGYAVATRGTPGQQCTALKEYITCLAGNTGTGCDGVTTAKTLAEAAQLAITNLGTTDCPVTPTCQCEIDFAVADIATSTKECNELRIKMECLYKTEDLACDGTSQRSVLAAAVDTRMKNTPNPNCVVTTNAVCDCMVAYAKVDPSNNGAKCTGLKVLLDCLDGLSDFTPTSCDTTQSVKQLATSADGLWTAMGNANCATQLDTQVCTVNFLKTTDGVLCDIYKTKMDCLVASEGDNTVGVARHTYAATTEGAMNTACGGSAPGAGTVCKDCETVYAKTANSCTALKAYYHCLYGLKSGTSCDGSKSTTDLTTEQDTNLASLTCLPLDDTCVCQVDFLKSTAADCSKLQVLMNCLWAATSTACDGSDKRNQVATAADTYITNTGGCRTSLSAICACQVAYAKVDHTSQPAHCMALKNQFQCLEGETGTGCESSRTLQDVASGGNTKIAADSACTPSDACSCQITYQIADVSDSTKQCTETQKKIACLYATVTPGCGGSPARTDLMTSTDAIANTCGYTSSCGCQRTYGKDSTGNECSRQQGVIKCLQGTVDTGCTGVSPFTKTRTALATDAETYITDNSCTKTDTCQCQIDYAKASVDPTDPDKCKALGELIVCLAGKTAAGCDGTSKASDLASTAHSLMQTDGCSISNTCNCQITYAKIDFSGGDSKCTGLLNQLECVFGTADKGCDTVAKRGEVGTSIVGHLTTESCTGSATDTCSSCIYAYAQVDVENTATKCLKLGELLHCLDGKTASSCKNPSPETPATLASNAKSQIEASSSGCSALSDTCLCQYNYIQTPIATTSCSAQAARMECLVAATGMACDGATARNVYAGTAESILTGIGGCSASLTATCTTCEITYAKAPIDTKDNRCAALKDYFHCLDSQTTLSCSGSKTIKTLATEANTRAAADACSFGTTCTCQATFLMADKTPSGATCTALKDKMSCLAISFDTACDETSTRDAVATTNHNAITNEPCSSSDITDVCGCERTYAIEPFSDAGVHCTNLKAAVNCVEGKTAGGCGATATISSFATVVLGKINTLNPACTLSDTCRCQATYLSNDISTTTLKCTALEKKQACLFAATSVACDGSTSRKDTIISVDGEIVTASCTIPNTCRCQIDYGKETITPDTAKCTAMEKMIQCLQSTEDNGCRGDQLVTRTQLATSVEDFATSSSDCTLSDACVCQKDYAKADVTGANKCTELKKLVVCLGATPTPGCTTIASHTLAGTAVGLINGISSCAPAAGTTCKCELDYAMMDRSTLSAACTAKKTLIKCLESSTGVGCKSDSKNTIASDVETYMNNAANSCAKTATCACQIELAKTAIDTNAPKCSALKAKLVCMRTTNDVACDGSTTKVSEATNTELIVTNMGDANCHVEDSCQCEFNHAKTDTSSDTCTAAKTLIHCLTTTSEAGCVGTKKSVGDSAKNVIDSLGTSTCPLTASCTCQQTYVTTAVATESARCLGLKALAVCLGENNEVGCDGTTTKISHATTAESNAKAIASCNTGLTATCQCQIDYAKKDTSSNTLKCTAQAARMECIVASTDVTCDESTTRSDYAATAETALNNIPSCVSGLTATCTTCQIVYAKAASDTQINRCAALKTYFHCLDSQTTTSCSGSKSVSTLATEAKNRATSDNCLTALGTTCTCQADFLMVDKTPSGAMCIALKDKMSCLAKSFDTACDDSTTRDVVATTNDNAITTDSCTGITDVCSCERTYAKEPFSDAGVHCTNLKAAVNCLEGKTASGCGATATISSFATVVVGKINTLNPACSLQRFSAFEGQFPMKCSHNNHSLSDTCRCQATYLSDDISTTALKCTALEKKQACLFAATAVACDGTTSRMDTIISVDGEIGTASCTIPNTCRCQINYGKLTITPDTAKCTAMKGMIQCLQSTDDNGCRGDQLVTRTQLATSVEDFAGSSGDCSLSDACVCQKDYAKADVTGANKCTELKKLVVCLGTTTTTGCTGLASHTLAGTAVSLINGISSCGPASGTTCKCELDYAVRDRSTPAGACTAAKILINCLTSTTDAGCSNTKKSVADAAKRVIDDLGTSTCPLTESCKCQQTFVTTDATSDSTRCTAYKTLALCLGNNNDVGCDGTTSKISLATSAESKAKGIASCNAGITTTCQCELNYAKMDTSTNALKCTALYKELTCLFSASGASCLNPSQLRHQVATLVDNAANDVALSCPARSPECSCTATYATTDITTNSAKCTAAKALLSCMSSKTGTGCDGSQQAVDIVNAAETAISAVVTAGATCTLSDSCQCEVNFGKVTPTCTTTKEYFACLYTATASGCSGTSNSDLQTAAKSKVLAITGCTLGDTCQCQETYRTSYAADSSQQCKYAKNALSCLSTASEKSCDDTQTKIQVTNEFVNIQKTITSSTCFLTETCKCQIAYGQANITTNTNKCSAGIIYRDCLNNIQNDQDVGCDDTTQKRHLMDGHVTSVLTVCSGCSQSKMSLTFSIVLVLVAIMVKN